MNGCGTTDSFGADMKLNRRGKELLLCGVFFCCCEDPPAPASDPPGAITAAAQSAVAPAAPAPAAEPGPAPEPEKPPEAVAAQHVLITYRGAKNAPRGVTRSKAKAKQLAEEVAKQASSGADFSALVKEYSEDPGTKDRLGSVGKFTPDKMVKPFSDAAFKLKVGEVSGVVETEFGYHVIKRNQ